MRPGHARVAVVAAAVDVASAAVVIAVAAATVVVVVLAVAAIAAVVAVGARDVVLSRAGNASARSLRLLRAARKYYARKVKLPGEKMR